MKYKLLRPLPWYGIGHIIDTENKIEQSFLKNPENFPDFFEPIVEKKTYNDLKHMKDRVWSIHWNWDIVSSTFSNNKPRSETFLTREEAEDEHRRREWAVRPDRFIPWAFDEAWFSLNWADVYCKPQEHQWFTVWEICMINLWLAFRTREECEEAIASHDLIRLFYTIR